MKNKIIISIFIILCIVVGLFGTKKIYDIVTRFEYDKLPKITFSESINLKESCAYVFYTLDNDTLTNFAIESIYDLRYRISNECNIYVVYMNDLENQKGFNSIMNNNIYLETLPMLISIKDSIYGIEKIYENNSE